MKIPAGTAAAVLAILVPAIPAQETKPPARPNVEAAKSAVKNVDAAGAKKILDEAAAKKDPKVKVLDIRTPDEFKDGHIAGAVNVDFLSKDFAEKAGALDKDTTWVLHCASGRRSTKSLETFTKLGFKSILHLDGGFAAWQKAGLPVEKTK
jgi:rhodanese-related sulfurtransferase